MIYGLTATSQTHRVQFSLWWFWNSYDASPWSINEHASINHTYCLYHGFARFYYIIVDNIYARWTKNETQLLWIVFGNNK